MAWMVSRRFGWHAELQASHDHGHKGMATIWAGCPQQLLRGSLLGQVPTQVLSQKEHHLAIKDPQWGLNSSQDDPIFGLV